MFLLNIILWKNAFYFLIISLSHTKNIEMINIMHNSVYIIRDKKYAGTYRLFQLYQRFSGKLNSVIATSVG